MQLYDKLVAEVHDQLDVRLQRKEEVETEEGVQDPVAELRDAVPEHASEEDRETLGNQFNELVSAFIDVGIRPVDGLVVRITHGNEAQPATS